MRTTILLLMALLQVSGFAQQPAANKAGESKPAAAPALPPDAPSKEQLMRLFDVMEVQKQMAGMVNAVGSNMEKMMPSSMGDISEKQRAAMASLNTELFGKMMSPEFIDTYLQALIPIYQRHFTKSEVDDLISFYSTPVGRKFLREQPLLTQESLGTVMPLMQKRVQEVTVEMDYENRLKGIFADQEEPPPQPKK